MNTITIKQMSTAYEEYTTNENWAAEIAAENKKEKAGYALASLRKKERVQCHECAEFFDRHISKITLNPPVCKRCQERLKKRKWRAKKVG